MGVSLTMDERNSVPLYLADGQQLMMNIDEKTFAKVSFGMLYVQVYSADGQIIEDAKVSLEADSRILEPYGQSGSDSIFMTQSGPYTLHVTCDGFKDLKQAVTVKELSPGESPNTEKYKLTIRLQRE